MDAIKQRRMLTETELLSIVESNDPELAAAEEKLGAIARQILDGIYEPGMFAQLVKSGAFTASTVMFEGQPAFVMIHSRNGLGWLIVEGVAAIGKAPLKVLFDAGDALARHYQSAQILFVTRIRSLYRYATEHGYGTMGIIVAKGAKA